MYDQADTDHTPEMVKEAEQLHPQPQGIRVMFYPKTTLSSQKKQQLLEILRETIALQLDITEVSITIKFEGI